MFNQDADMGQVHNVNFVSHELVPIMTMDPNSPQNNTTHLLKSSVVSLPLNNLISQTTMSLELGRDDVQQTPQLMDCLLPPSQTSEEPLQPQKQQEPTQLTLSRVYTLTEEPELEVEEEGNYDSKRLGEAS